MKKNIVILSVLLLALAGASGQSAPAPAGGTTGLDELQKQFEATIRDVQRQEQETAKLLRQRYLAGLTALEDALQSAGNQLTAVFSVHAEKERFEQSGDIPASALSAEWPALRKLQEAWCAQTAGGPRTQAQKIVAASERYLQSLALLQRNLTARNDARGVAEVRAEKDRLLGDNRMREALALLQMSPPAGETKSGEPAAASKKPEKGTPGRIYWSCADDADVYLNGEPLRNYTPDFHTRPDEANQEFTAAARIAKGDIITVGARRGGSFGFLMVVLDESGKVIFRTDARKWQIYYPRDNQGWYLPATAARSRKGKVSLQPQPWPPQRGLQSRFDSKALSIWDHQEPQAFLFATVE